MKVVRPDPVESVAATFWWVDQVDQVTVIFGEDKCRPRALVGHRGELSQDVAWGVVEDGVGGVEAEAVEAVLVEPVAARFRRMKLAHPAADGVHRS